MTGHRIATREEWLAASAELLRREKEITRTSDELARQRRELPWLQVEREYALQTADGSETLVELFDGRSQLVVYHFMFGNEYDAGCLVCSSTADSFNGVIAHLNARDVTMICVAHAPIDKLLAYRERMGWTFNWASSSESDFNFDYGVSVGDGMTHRPAAPLLKSNELGLLKLQNEQPRIAIEIASASGTNPKGYLSEGHGFSTFTREGDTVYRCYSSYARGTEFLMGYYPILDRAPKGRNEGEGATRLGRQHGYDNDGRKLKPPP